MVNIKKYLNIYLQIFTACSISLSFRKLHSCKNVYAEKKRTTRKFSCLSQFGQKKYDIIALVTSINMVGPLKRNIKRFQKRAQKWRKKTEQGQERIYVRFYRFVSNCFFFLLFLFLAFVTRLSYQHMFNNDWKTVFAAFFLFFLHRFFVWINLVIVHF